MKELLPDKYGTALILALTFLIPLTVVYKIVYTPDGFSYAFYTDELVQVATSNSYMWGFENPYGLEGLVFSNPVLGSVYLQIAIGLISSYLSLDPMFVLYIVNIIFSFFLLLFSYMLLGVFVQGHDKRIVGFLFFIIASNGLAGLSFIILGDLNILTQEQLIHFIGKGGLNGVFFTYHTVSLALGYLALLMLLNTPYKIWKVALLLGGAVIIYPLYSAAFLGLSTTYLVLKRNYTDLVKMLAGVMPFSAAWLLPLLLSQQFYFEYLKKADYVNIAVFAVFSAFLAPLAIYYAYVYSKQKKTLDLNFLIIWAVSVIFLTLSPAFPPFQPQRFLNMVWLPLSILATLGFYRLLDKRSDLVKTTLAILIILISLPTTLLWYSQGINDRSAYMEKTEVDALLFLRSYPEGLVLAREDLGLRVPYFAEKRSLLSGVQSFDLQIEKPSNNITHSEKLKILIQKYNNIIYVITRKEFGEFNTIYSKDGTYIQQTRR